MQRLKIKRTFLRVAMTLVVMLFTTVSAWAFKTQTVSYIVSCNGSTITISGGGENHSCNASSSMGYSYWDANVSCDLANSMTIKPSASLTVTGIPITIASTTFTFTTSGTTAITGVTFKKVNENVGSSTSSEPVTTFSITIPANTTFTSFEVTFGYISGKCGTSATWSLAKQNGQYTALTIGGSGAMRNYNAGDTPWGSDVTTATVGSGITAIGDNAFNGCSALPRFTIQKTDGLVSLGTGVFTGCSNLQYIIAPTPALAVQYKTATNWSTYASKLRVTLGSYLFTATNEGRTAAYEIASETDLRNLSAAVRAGNGANGLTFRQTSDIHLSDVDFTPIGGFIINFGDPSEYFYFYGNYDGGNYTISGLNVKNLDDNNESFGLFGYVQNGTVKNVRLVGPCVWAGNIWHANGVLIGQTDNATVENCVVINPSLTSRSAIIGINSSSTLRNLYFYDNANNYALVGTNDDGTLTRVARARKVTLGSGVTVSPAASDPANGFVYNNESYYREGLQLTIGSTDSNASTIYIVNGSAISGSTYTVNSADITITAANLWTGSGDSETAPYIISNEEQLSMLAIRVNSGIGDEYAATGYSGKYFKLVDDITYTHNTNWNDASSTENNYTAIGSYSRPFCGHFDGQNHVVSGIRIYKGGVEDSDECQGLFGCIQEGHIKNIILADARITGYDNVGAIVDRNKSGTVENCHVLSNVRVHTVQTNCISHSGIVGENRNGGTVTGCTSGAAITIADAIVYTSNYGGIAGVNYDSTVEDCIYFGSTIEGISYVGAIVGYNGGTVRNCYYTDANISGKDDSGNALDNAASAIGYNVTTSFFVVSNCGPAPQDNADNSTFLALMAARNTALTAVEHTTPLSTAVDITLQGRKLYKDGDWNTLCLPFDMTNAQIAASALADATLMELDTDAGLYEHVTGLDNGTLYLNFKDATSIEAGKPYLIKWAKANDYVDDNAHNIVTPTFSDVTIDNTDRSVTSSDGYVTFKGTYDRKEWNEENKSILFVGENNTLYYPKSGAFVNACRAYFELSDDSQAREFVMNFDGEATGISDALRLNDKGQMTNDNFYDLQGRKIEKPTKGLYIH